MTVMMSAYVEGIPLSPLILSVLTEKKQTSSQAADSNMTKQGSDWLS